MRRSAVVLAVIMAGCCAVFAENPIIRDVRTADPSAHVWADGKVWLYTSHDVSKNFNQMDGYHAFSSSDLVHWKDYGEVLHSRDIPWGVSGLMWAPTAAYRNGKYYLIYPHAYDATKKRDFRCGVAVSDVPEGPFKDIGWIEGVTGRWLDPCYFEDTDGTPYLYWGVKEPYVAKLKDNLLELAEAPRKIEYGQTDFMEGIYMHKKGDTYYLSYNVKNKPQGDYAIADNPYGPFEHKGPVLEGVSQDHHSIIEYKGQWYIFYHWQNWNGGGTTMRNVAVEHLYYNKDGTIQPAKKTEAGVTSVKSSL